MALLSIVFVFLLARYTGLVHYLHRDTWFASTLNQFALRKPHSWLIFVALFGAVVLLAVVWWQLDFWLSFFLGVFLLLYSVGRGDWCKGMRNLALQLREENPESVLLHLEESGVMPSDQDTGQALWLAWRRYAGCWCLDRVFAVFFWFFILGPAGAVLYRWAVMYNNHEKTHSGDLPSAKKLQHFLEWLPVRFMGGCACLAGNFTTGMRIWQKNILDTQITSADFLAQCLDEALILDVEVSLLPEDVEYSLRLTLQRSAALEMLMKRTEILGIVSLALAILILR